MYVCIIDQKGKTPAHQNLKTDPEALFEAIFPLLEDVVTCVGRVRRVASKTLNIHIGFLLF
jgi:hypothetical protein